MPDSVLAIFAMLVFLFFVSLALILLVRPSLFLRRIPNPLLPDTPWNRVQMRGIGLVFCLVVLLVLSGGAPESELHEGFHRNILVALWVSVFTVPILLWILWQFSVRSFVRQGYINGTSEDPAWERRMTLVFCTTLFSVIVLALLLAAKGHHP